MLSLRLLPANDDVVGYVMCIGFRFAGGIPDAPPALG